MLEISATPYIFTFKLWDWGRLGLDGLPRPVHLDHGQQVIDWQRDTQWVHDNLVNRIEPRLKERVGGKKEPECTNANLSKRVAIGLRHRSLTIPMAASTS